MVWGRRSRAARHVRRARSRGGSRDGLAAKFGGNDGTSWSAGDDIALAGEQRVGDIDRSTRGCEVLCKAPHRWQAIAGPELAICNRGPKMLVDLTIERDAVVAHQYDAAFPRHADHGLVILSLLGPFY